MFVYCSCLTNGSCYYLQVKIAEFSETPDDFLRKYDELKSKNVRNLDPLVYLLSKLSEDKEVRNAGNKMTKKQTMWLSLTCNKPVQAC